MMKSGMGSGVAGSHFLRIERMNLGQSGGEKEKNLDFMKKTLQNCKKFVKNV